MPTRSGKSFSVAETPDGNAAPASLHTASKKSRTQATKCAKGETKHTEILPQFQRKGRKEGRSTNTISAGQVSKDPGHAVVSARKADKQSSNFVMIQNSGHIAKEDSDFNKRLSSRLDSLSILKRAKPHDYIDLTQDDSDQDLAAKPVKRPRCDNKNDSDDSDSRYALTRRKPGQARKPAQHLVPLSAELLMEEQKNVAQASTELHTASDFAIPVRSTHEDDRHNSINVPSACNQKSRKPVVEQKKPGKKMQVIGQQQSVHSLKQNTEDIPRVHEPARAIMFSIPEAVAALNRIKDDPNSIPKMSYDLHTGDFLSYPVDRSYHLGAMGRYSVSVTQTRPTPRNTSAVATFRADKIASNDSAAHPANFRFETGCNKGCRIFNVKHSYLRYLQRNPTELQQHPGLREALEYYWPDGKIRSNPQNRSIQSFD